MFPSAYRSRNSTTTPARTLLERSWSGGHCLWSLLPLWKFWAALQSVRTGQISAPSKFTTGLLPPSQSLAPLDASSWILWSTTPAQKSWMLDHRCFTSFAMAVIKLCTNFGGAISSRIRTSSTLNKQSSIYQNFYQSYLFNSVVKSGMPLHQL